MAGDWLGRDTYHPYFEWMRKVAPLETWYRWWGGKEIFHQAPLYPYLLAGLLALGGGSVPFVLLAQLVIGAVQPLVMYRLASLLFEPRVGLAAAAFTALYGPFIFHQGVLLRDWLSPILEPLAVLALLRGKQRGGGWACGMAGGALGLALLAKETALLLILLMLVWIFLDHRRAWRQAATAASWVLVGLLLSLSPLVLRNAVVGAPLFALSNRAAEAFAVANKPDTTFERGLADILERSGGGLLPATMDTVRSYQGDWPGLVSRQLWKLKAVKDPFEIPNNISFAYGVELSPALRWTLGFSVIFPLGLAGFGLSLKAPRRYLAILLYGIAAVAGLMLTSPIARYRLVLVPVLILYAAVVVIRFAVTIRHQEGRQAIGLLGLIVGCVLFQQFVLRLPQGVYSLDYLAAARAYAEERQFDRAAAEMGRLLEKVRQGSQHPTDVPLFETDYHLLLARHLLQQGNREETKHQAGKGAAAYARYRQHGGEAAYPYFNLGLLYRRFDEPAKARDFFERFLILEPEGPRAEQVRRILSR